MANCSLALTTASSSLGVPIVLSAEDMSSPQLDELSCLTYVSYFIRSPDAPGVATTLNRVRQLLPQCNVNNFQVRSSFPLFVVLDKIATSTERLERRFITGAIGA